MSNHDSLKALLPKLQLDIKLAKLASAKDHEECAEETKSKFAAGEFVAEGAH